MQEVQYAAAGTAFTFLLTALGSAAVFCLRRPRMKWRVVALGFAAGVMLAATVFSLLLPAMEYAKDSTLPVWIPAFSGLIVGAMLLLLLEILLDRLRSVSALPRALQGVSRGNTLMFAAVTLHNIPEGMAVALSFALAVRTGDPALLLSACSLALGVGVQNLPEGAALSLPLHEEGMGKGRAFLLGAASAVVEPIFGVLAVLLSAVAQPVLPYLLGFAAGAMLLVSVRELIPQSCCEESGTAGTLSVLAGFALMMLLDVAL